MSQASRYHARWRVQVARIAESGFYKSIAKAEEFVYEHVTAAWHRADGDIGARRVTGITDTQLLLLHLFARAALGVGMEEKKSRRMLVWPPSFDPGIHCGPVFHRAIPTADLGLMIGRSKGTVRAALRGFKNIAMERYGAVVNV